MSGQILIFRLNENSLLDLEWTGIVVSHSATMIGSMMCQCAVFVTRVQCHSAGRM